MHDLIDCILTIVVPVIQVLLSLQLQRRELRLSEVAWLGPSRTASACASVSQPRLSAQGPVPSFGSTAYENVLALRKPLFSSQLCSLTSPARLSSLVWVLAPLYPYFILLLRV